MFLRKLQFFFSHLVFHQICVMFSTQTNVFHNTTLLEYEQKLFSSETKGTWWKAAAPGKCKNIAMQQQIELSLSISVFFHPQQLRRPVLDCFLAFASLQGWGELCPAHRLWGFHTHTDFREISLSFIWRFHWYPFQILILSGDGRSAAGKYSASGRYISDPVPKIWSPDWRWIDSGS